MTKKSYFTFRGRESLQLDLLGISVYDLMKGRLQAEEGTGDGERVVLDPVYPFLTREQLLRYLDEREGSYSFAGGYVVRNGCPLTGAPRPRSPALGQGLFSLADYPAALRRAAEESAACHLARGALVEEGAEVSFSAVLKKGAIVRRGSRVLGKSVIGEDAEIVRSEISDFTVGAGSVVSDSILTQAAVGERCKVGPFACLRPNTTVGDGCRIGNFVELKNAHVGRESKIAHLAYVGDAELGARVNVGCGVVFVNYNGKCKSVTVVGDGAFLGSNCNLIAPVVVGEGAFLAAGTTLTHDLEADDFCIGRCRETVKPNCAKRYYDPK